MNLFGPGLTGASAADHLAALEERIQPLGSSRSAEYEDLADKRNAEFQRKSLCKDEGEWKQVKVQQYGMEGLRASRYPAGNTPHIYQLQVRLDSDAAQDYETCQFFKDRLKQVQLPKRKTATPSCQQLARQVSSPSS